MNLRVFLSIAPVVAFLVVSRAADAWVAVAAGFGASVLVFLFARRDRLIGVLSLFGLAVVGVSAALGVFWNSERAYLASGPASDFLFVPLYLASIWLRRPLVGSIVDELFPRRFATIPANHHVFVRLSLAWAGFDVVHGVVLTTLLLNLGIVEYVVWSRVLGWPMTGTMLVMSFLTVERTAKQAASVPQHRALAHSPPG
ncbi:MAG: DUF3159 domain-containing protein [Dehalococcoidia bacterium]